MVCVCRLTAEALEQPGIVTIQTLLCVLLRSQACAIALGNTSLPLCPLLTAQTPPITSRTSPAPLPPPPLLLHLQLLPPPPLGNTVFCLLLQTSPPIYLLRPPLGALGRLSCVRSPLPPWLKLPQFLHPAPRLAP